MFIQFYSEEVLNISWGGKSELILTSVKPYQRKDPSRSRDLKFVVSCMLYLRYYPELSKSEIFCATQWKYIAEIIAKYITLEWFVRFNISCTDLFQNLSSLHSAPAQRRSSVLISFLPTTFQPASWQGTNYGKPQITKSRIFIHRDQEEICGDLGKAGMIEFGIWNSEYSEYCKK